jgi:hypothetical protein
MLLLLGVRDVVNMDVKDCSTWFLVENQSKMTYPLPLGFQHTQYCDMIV